MEFIEYYKAIEQKITIINWSTLFIVTSAEVRLIQIFCLLLPNESSAIHIRRLLGWLHPIVFLLALACPVFLQLQTVLFAGFPFLLRLVPFHLLHSDFFHSAIFGIISFLSILFIELRFVAIHWIFLFLIVAILCRQNRHVHLLLLLPWVLVVWYLFV